ncbi:MAG: hypothetical protein AABW63_00720 [Nanoarchaeota archaeon]
MNGEYLILLILFFLLFYLINKKFNLKVFKRKSSLLLLFAVSIIVFGIWDLYAILNHHWIFNKNVMLAYLGIFPAEEIIFVIFIITLGPIIIWEWAKKVFKNA